MKSHISLLLALVMAAILVRPVPGPRFEVRGDELLGNGQPILQVGSYFAGQDIWWQLGFAEQFQGGEEYGEYHAQYSYPSKGITIFVGEMGISGFEVQRL